MSWLRAVTLSALLAAAGQAHAVDYESVDVPFAKDAQNLKDAGKAVSWTLLERQWKVDREDETSIQATLDRPDDDTSLTVLITFDRTHAVISYVRGYARGVKRGDTWPRIPVPKNKYEGWVGNLAKDIPVYLQRLQIILQ